MIEIGQQGASVLPLNCAFFLNVCVSFVQGSTSCIGPAPFAWLRQVNDLASAVISSHFKMKCTVANAARVEERWWQVAQQAPSIGGR